MQVLIPSALICVLLNWLTETKANCSCLKPAMLILIVAALNSFSLTSQRSYCGRNVSCLGTTESHLEHNASLLLQLHKLLQEKVSSFSQKICITYSCARHGLITRS